MLEMAVVVEKVDRPFVVTLVTEGLEAMVVLQLVVTLVTEGLVAMVEQRLVLMLSLATEGLEAMAVLHLAFARNVLLQPMFQVKLTLLWL